MRSTLVALAVASILCGAAPAVARVQAAGDSQPSPAPDATAVTYDVFTRVLSAPQRSALDRDPRCKEARALTDEFVASGGAALQTGVDAMTALEKCAVLPRVGDWSDFRDYAVLAAAAIAYAVGDRANNDGLLRRAVDDAAHVHGYDASAMSVRTYGRAGETDVETNGGHRMGEGPIESSKIASHDVKRIATDGGGPGSLATQVAAAATRRLAALQAR